MLFGAVAHKASPVQTVEKKKRSSKASGVFGGMISKIGNLFKKSEP